ncbi:MAG TPA: MMPL family transporter [Candidatus Limnocylindrales bacterium]|nr:MMPL family transporter [Candidatus Limnocylindrales bacterium]
MTGNLEDRIAAAAAGWVARIERSPKRALALILAATGAAAAYAALTLGVDADPRSLISEDLPFQVRQRELINTFHTLGDGFLVVIDADSPVAAGHAAEALAERLAQRKDLFTQVDVPGGGPFYARNALLYLSLDQIDDLTTRLSQVQPFVATLERDPSIAGVADLLRDALAAQRKGTPVGLELPVALDRVATAVQATIDRRPAPDPWGTALLGSTLPAEARQRVVALRGKLDFGTLLNAGPHVDAIRTTAVELGLTPERGYRVRITGEPVLNYEELIAIATQNVVVGVTSFLLFSITVAFAFRSFRITLALVSGLVVGLAWSNGFAALAIGHLNQISAVANVLIIGLGGELQIHVCMRYRELIASGVGRSRALRETAESMAPSLFSSACTTAIGFFIFLLTDFTGVAQLGVIAGCGMFFSFASAFTMVPAVLSLGGEPSPRPPRKTAVSLTNLAHLPLRYAGPIRIAAVAAALASLLTLPFIRFNYNLLDLRDPATESVQTFEDLLARPGSTPWIIDVVTPSLAEARVLASRIAQLEEVAAVRTIDDYVPAQQEEKLETLQTAEFFLLPEGTAPQSRSVEEQRQALQKLAEEAERTSREAKDAALAGAAQRLHQTLTRFLTTLEAEASPAAALAGLHANLVGSLPEQLRDLRLLLKPQRVVVEDLPANLASELVAPSGQARIQVFARDDLSDSAALERFVDRVREVAPQATGSAVWQVEWGRATWHAMVLALSIGIVLMIAFLVVLWRSVWDTILAFFPLALAMLLTCASLVVLGHPFNFGNVIVLPMLVGMGVDNGIHLVHRHRTRPDEIDVLASSTARAVFFSALTTILTFGSLGFSSHRGSASIGQLLALGVFWTLVCYVVVLPAVLEWDDRRRLARKA